MSTSAANAQAFYDEVVREGAVWGIRDADGFPAPANENDERAMPFWSLSSRAESVVGSVDAYAGFEVVEIPLSAFVERWLPGLDRDGLRVGLNWSGDRATGYDIPAREVLARLEAAQ